MDVACDACCVINFLAGEEILSRVPTTGVVAVPTMQLFVPSQVSQESLYLLQPDPIDPNSLIKSPIVLSPYFDAGVIRSCQIETVEENELFVRLATDVDDGEASCLAIAKCRGMAIATDDRPASRLASHLEVAVINTPQFIRMWAEGVRASREQVAATINRIQRFAKFVPRGDAADADWWFAHAS